MKLGVQKKNFKITAGRTVFRKSTPNLTITNGYFESNFETWHQILKPIRILVIGFFFTRLLRKKKNPTRLFHEFENLPGLKIPGWRFLEKSTRLTFYPAFHDFLGNYPAEVTRLIILPGWILGGCCPLLKIYPAAINPATWFVCFLKIIWLPLLRLRSLQSENKMPKFWEQFFMSRLLFLQS